jgi:hypothetical protein
MAVKLGYLDKLEKIGHNNRMTQSIICSRCGAMVNWT